MPTAGATTPVKGQRKTKVGRVVSDRMDKTIVVSVERLTRHRLYKRVVRASTKFAAHDESNEARIGDTVLIEESRPLSATKRWRLVSVLASPGDIPGGEDLITEETETTEAIHHTPRVVDAAAVAEAGDDAAVAEADADAAETQADADAEESGADSGETQA